MAEITIHKAEYPPLRCLIVDDEALAIKGIALYIDKLGFLQISGTCSSAIEAVTMLKEKEIDLLFLDVNMPHLSGLEFLEALEHPPMTILTTAYSEYALEGYRLNVVDYLLKPVAFHRFFQAASKARELYRSRCMLQYGERQTDADAFVRQGDSFRRIRLEDILYIEGMQNYLKLHFEDKTIIIHQTMASLQTILPDHSFFRFHRSFLVNLAHVEKMSGNRLFIHGKELPVALSRKEEFVRMIHTKLLSK